VQGRSADIWKKNIMEDLESEILSYIIVREFLSDLKEEFSRKDDKTLKVLELKKIEQENKTIEEFVQEFRRAARESSYERSLLVEEFKQVLHLTFQPYLFLFIDNYQSSSIPSDSFPI